MHGGGKVEMCLVLLSNAIRHGTHSRRCNKVIINFASIVSKWIPLLHANFLWLRTSSILNHLEVEYIVKYIKKWCEVGSYFKQSPWALKKRTLVQVCK